jgi:hypothetical protein
VKTSNSAKRHQDVSFEMSRDILCWTCVLVSVGQVNKPEIENEELPESIKTGRIYFL